MDEEGYAVIKFTDAALADFRRSWPDLPPGDEMLIKVKLGPCKFCGQDCPVGEIGGIDPDGVTENGELLGSFVCGSCMKKGL